MKFLSSRAVRIGSAVVCILCLCLLAIHTLNIRESEVAPNEEENERIHLILEEQERQKEEEERLKEEEDSIAYEKELQSIDDRRLVKEPIITFNNSDHLLSKYYIAVPTPIAPWTNDTISLLYSPLGQRIEADLFTMPEEKPDFKLLTYQQRIFKSILQYLDPLVSAQVDISHYKDTWDLYQRLENSLYTWIRPYQRSVFDMRGEGKGIVMCVGDGQFKFAVSSIHSIRSILKSEIPIEVFYIDKNDLSAPRRKYLESTFSNLKTVAIDQRINNKITRFGGWSLKPYAILASQFEEVILMDADVFFFRKPEVLFSDAGYQATGALFFFDRTLFDHYYTGRRWLRSFLPTMSSFVQQSRWWKTTSAHEQESGVVVMNKRKVLYGLLSVCKMNDKAERDKVSYDRSYGDKETFWIGFEMVQTPYAFVRSVGGVIGGIGDGGNKSTVCGNLVHLGADNRPLWWNGGLLRNKNKWASRYMKFEHFAEGEKWDFDNSCIKETDKIRKLNQRERKLGAEYIKLDKLRREEMKNTELEDEDD
ncbi:mannosyltransferase putative-domain-containing protein [Pilobolus umbonatus]|nr:mannosyltransferase putative-domain-containing protein [Pilobolus umbonatus]